MVTAARGDLALVLRRLGVAVEIPPVIARAVIDGDTARQLLEHAAPEAVLVADLLTEDARELLTQEGRSWWDRRGRLHLTGPNMLVHTDAAAFPRQPSDTRTSTATSPITGAMLEVAVATLVRPDQPPGVREIARTSDLNPSSISRARTRLRDLGLIGRDHTPIDTELFWATARAWRATIRWTPIGILPVPSDQLLAVGTQAAVTLGAPIVATADYPPALLATDRDIAAALRFRHQTDTTPSARVAPSPAAYATTPHPDRLVTPQGHSIAHPTVVALDLASDPARGAEAVRQWTPEDSPRVW